jgi:two-component system response regulator QseB
VAGLQIPAAGSPRGLKPPRDRPNAFGVGIRSAASEPSASFLVVEDDVILATSLARSVRRTGTVVIVSSVAAAEAALSSAIWTGIVLDVMLPDGSGIDLLARIRRRDPRTPVLVMTGSSDPAIANACDLHGASCVFKPDVGPNLELFVARAIAARDGEDERVGGALQALARTKRLSPRETEVALLAARGVRRNALARELGISENTIKKIVRGLLTKLDANRLEDVARLVLAHAVRGPVRH